MASVASRLIEEVTAHAQSDSLEDAREIWADSSYFPNNLLSTCFGLSATVIRSCFRIIFRRVRSIAKSDYSFMSVRPPVRMEQLSFHWTDFHEIWYKKFYFFENLSRKLKFHWNRTRIKGTLYEDSCTFLIICRSLILRIRWGSQKVVETIKTHFVFRNFFENRAVCGIRWKILQSGAGYRWQYGACALHVGHLRLQTHTHTQTYSQYVMLIASSLKQWLYERA